ncbi:MAG: DUF3990 domain-containing protein [Dysgonamonadaceae bacterium]|jgi:hypothetical protein|nr:DUF3990 domain-containing protein [Dysgonamonadaceae bacterium]
MKVYHGSYCEIDKIDLFKGELARDFGLGFYVTNLYQQAEYWATRKGKQRKTQGVINEYIFYESAFISNYFKTLRFVDYSEEWLDFVVMNRQNDTTKNLHDYDIVEGPVADDDIATRIEVYVAGGITKTEFLEELKFKHTVSHQIAFCTQKSLQMIKKAFSKVDLNEMTIDDAITQSLIVDFGMNDYQAIDAYFNSETYSLLIDENTKYYEKSWHEIYEILKKELKLQ